MTNYNPKEERNDHELKNDNETEQKSSNEHSVDQQLDEQTTLSTENRSEVTEGSQQSTEATEEKASATKVIREIETIEEYEEKTAGFWIRFWAFITDSLIVSAVIGILVNPFFYLLDLDLSSTDWYAPITIISGIVYYTYFVITTKIWQQTVGKMIFGLKVIPTHGEKLTWSSVLFREIVSRFINNTIMPLYLIVAFTPKNMGIQDYVADTLVVQEKVFVKNEKKIVKEKQVEVNDSIHPTA